LNSFSNEEIEVFYDRTEISYRRVWDLKNSLALHYGHWDESTSNFGQALTRQNAFMAELAGITEIDQVLDAGCGVGGSSVHLARDTGCRATGITLSAKQVESARRNARRFGVEARTAFKKMDYLSTDFEDESFSVVWGIESVCHASDKASFLREAFRLLKPGGRLVIADAYLTRETYNSKEQQLMDAWLNGWAVESIQSVEYFEEHSKKAGFKDCSFTNTTSNVQASAWRLYLISFPAILVSWIQRLGGGFVVAPQNRTIWK
jgi:tocopherol O-methyltransferase